MIPKERLTRQNRKRDGEGRKNTPAHSHCLFGERPCTGYTGGAPRGALLGAVSDVSIASCQSRSHDRSHRNTRFPGLLVILIHPDFEKFDFALEELFQFLGLCISLIDGSKSERLLQYCRDEIYWLHLSVFGLSEGNLEE